MHRAVGLTFLSPRFVFCCLCNHSHQALGVRQIRQRKDDHSDHGGQQKRIKQDERDHDPQEAIPKKVLYPGVLAFYRELDLGPNSDQEWDDSRLGNLVFLSARPHVYKDVSEEITYKKFRMLQVSTLARSNPHSMLCSRCDESEKDYNLRESK